MNPPAPNHGDGFYTSSVPKACCFDTSGDLRLAPSLVVGSFGTVTRATGDANGRSHRQQKAGDAGTSKLWL